MCVASVLLAAIPAFETARSPEGVTAGVSAQRLDPFSRVSVAAQREARWDYLRGRYRLLDVSHHGEPSRYRQELRHTYSIELDDVSVGCKVDDETAAVRAAEYNFEMLALLTRKFGFDPARQAVADVNSGP